MPVSALAQKAARHELRKAQTLELLAVVVKSQEAHGHNMTVLRDQVTALDAACDRLLDSCDGLQKRLDILESWNRQYRSMSLWARLCWVLYGV